MKTYTIYEIPGVKIGCTEDVVRRQKQQRDKGKMVVLESLTCIEEATRRERELQLAKGYEVKGSYKQNVINSRTVCRTPEAIKKRVNNTDWKRLGKLTSKRQKGKPVTYLLTPEAIAKRVANTDHKGKSSHLQRAVISISPEGIVTEHTGIGAAARDLEELTGIKFNTGSIHNVCNPNCKQYKSKGYTFEYSDK
jgi:hypothetical protein